MTAKHDTWQDLTAAIERLMAELMAEAVRVLTPILEHMAAMFAGQSTPLDLLVEDAIDLAGVTEADIDRARCSVLNRTVRLYNHRTIEVPHG